MLPDVLILGAQKAGTTSLYNYLIQHPQVAGAFGKEVHYFDGGVNPAVDNYALGADWYRAHFPVAWERSKPLRACEGTPMYLFNPEAPGRIKNLVPEARLIVLLRNPVDRAVSHYFHSVRRGRETMEIGPALRAEEERLQPVYTSGDYSRGEFRYFSYKQRGLYAEQLQRYREYFPAGQMLVLNSEEFFANPSAVLRRVFEFIDVASDFAVPDLAPRNVAERKIELSSDDQNYLANFFHQPNLDLYDLLGTDMGW